MEIDNKLSGIFVSTPENELMAYDIRFSCLPGHACAGFGVSPLGTSGVCL